jgi:hypothetical protein
MVLAGTGGGAGDGAEALNTLLVSGAQFLMSLSKAIAQPAGVQDDNATGGGPFAAADGAPSLQKAVLGMVGRDEATEKTYLKIPMPEAEAMNRIVSGLGSDDGLNSTDDLCLPWRPRKAGIDNEAASTLIFSP